MTGTVIGFGFADPVKTGSKNHFFDSQKPFLTSSDGSQPTFSKSHVEQPHPPDPSFPVLNFR
jgi:hypothetical protein